jgi:hypothetical protein
MPELDIKNRLAERVLMIGRRGSKIAALIAIRGAAKAHFYRAFLKKRRIARKARIKTCLEPDSTCGTLGCDLWGQRGR